MNEDQLGASAGVAPATTTDAETLLTRSLEWGQAMLEQTRPVPSAAEVMQALDDFERLELLLASGATPHVQNPDLADRANLIAPARHVVQHLLERWDAGNAQVSERLRGFLCTHPECTRVDGYEFSADWFTKKCAARWSLMFAPRRDAPNLSFLEIGSFEGRSALWLLENVITHPSSRLTCVDLFIGPSAGRFNRNMARAGHAAPIAQARRAHHSWAWRVRRSVDEWLVALGRPARLVTWTGSSRTVLRRLRGPFDFIYIDADHRAAAVMEDAVLAWPLLASGGTLLFDDYTNPDTASGIDAFLNVFRSELEVVTKGAQLELVKCG